MSAIKNALIKMNTAIDKLDGALANMEQPPAAGQQQDMFSANQNAAMARKLDSAIGKVEEILKESA